LTGSSRESGGPIYRGRKRPAFLRLRVPAMKRIVPIMSELTPIMFVTENVELGAELQSVLAANYAMQVEGDTEKAFDDLEATRLLALIVDDEIRPQGGLKFLGRAVNRFDKRMVPSLLLIHKQQENFVRKTDYLGDMNYMTKPVKWERLRAKVSEIVNSGVEKSWESLPPVQKSVLKETVSIFRDCFGSIQQGAPIPVGKIEQSCKPLVEAVTDNQVTGLLGAVQDHDDYTYVHSLRVAIYLSLLGHSIGIKGDNLLTLSSGGLMHDLGKCKIPHTVLNKPGRLTDDEFVVMKTHVDHTGDIFDKSNDISESIQVIALQHHEKIDGSGYPLGLKGGKLNELARMATIVDIYSALTDRRVYKPPMEAEKAISILESMPNEVDQNLLLHLKAYLLEATGLPE
jgi:HD-GYP domain-containing protein (c-di-GMP phosphodiesterase class II)